MKKESNNYTPRFTLQADDVMNQRAKISVIGVGGGGSNAVDHMVNEQIEGVEFYITNTDAQALGQSRVQNKIQFGKELTRGLGVGSNPRIGREAAVVDKQLIVEQIADSDMVFITAGMGGGTGTGAAPVISETLKEVAPDVLVVAVVTTPFEFEGIRRNECAAEGLKDLKPAVDSLITIPNDKILEDGLLPLKDAYAQANNVLLNAVQGIADLVIRPGFINVDFADVKTVMSESGTAMMGTGKASGDNRACVATHAAIENPLLADVEVSDAKGLLVNVTASSDMTAQELIQIGKIVQEVASPDATIIMGNVFDDSVDDEIRVTIVATGLIDKIEILEPEFPDDTFNGGGSFFGESQPLELGFTGEDNVPAVLRFRSTDFDTPNHTNGNNFDTDF